MACLFSGKKPIDDIEIYYEIHRDGVSAEDFGKRFNGGYFTEKAEDILFLLHGNNEDHTIFSRQLEAFAKAFTVITPDSRGHGQTSAGSQDFTIDLLAEDLAKFADELNIGRFRILGFSDGGNIALTYAIRHPERLSSLIVSGANLNPSGVKLSAQLPIAVSCFFAKEAKNKSTDANLHFQKLNLMVSYPHLSPRLLGNISCPTLVMAGDRDLIKKAHTEEIASCIPGSTLVFVPQSSHFVFGDNPEFVEKTVLDFLK